MTTAAPQPLEAFVEVNQRRLHYLDWGGDGPPILIVHATGFLARVYDRIGLALRAQGRVLAYDQTGHGDSATIAPAAISWDHTADELEGFITQMGLQKVCALGHSAGAVAIAAVASRAPDLIARALLIEPVIVDQEASREQPNDLYERTLKRKPVFDSFDAMYNNFRTKPPYSAWRPEVLHDYCEHGARREADGRRTLKCTPETEARLYQTARDFDGLSHILALAIPTLVVFGGASDSPGIDFAERIANSANRKTVTLQGRGHLLPMEDPDAVARLARDFFKI